MVLKSILMMLLTLLNLTSLFPKSDIQLLKDKINSRVQLTTSMKEDDPDIWYELDEWISMYFAYLLHFTIFIFSLLAYLLFYVVCVSQVQVFEYTLNLKFGREA
jgi:hypothetical protein